MALRVKTSGCFWSIVISVVLTVLLNLVLRACGGGGGGVFVF
jgi:hypothetical protein